MGRKFAFWILAAQFLAVGYFIYAISHGQWSNSIWSVCVAIAIPCWLLAVKAPTNCGVTTQRGTPCKHPTTGVVFGCNQAPNGSHVWAKLFARFGWHRQVFALPQRSAGPGPTSSGRLAGQELARSETVTVRIQEQRRNTIAFWLAFTSTIAGVTSAMTDISGLFR